MKPLPISRRSFIKFAAGASAGAAGGALWLGLSKSLGASQSMTEGDLPINSLAGQWDGDEATEAHRFFFPGQEQDLASALARARSGKDDSGVTRDPQLYDLVVVGGGISGLTALLRAGAAKSILLEKDAIVGGNSKKRHWGNLEYPIGAAYCVTPDEGDAIDRLYQEIGVKQRFKTPGEEAEGAFFQRKFVKAFWEGATDPGRAGEFAAFKAFVLTLDTSKFPDIPFVESKEGAYTRKEFEFLDQMTLANFFRKGVPADLEKLKAKGFPYEGPTVPMHPHIQEFVEYYCWSAFGASALEISAYAGLNFLAPEFGSISVLPGGNATIAEALLDRIDKQRWKISPPGSHSVRTGKTVLEIGMDAEGHYEIITAAGNALECYRAKAVILATPKFVARKIVRDLPKEQSDAMGQISYRPYLVANILLKRQPKLAAFDAYCLEGKLSWEESEEIEDWIARCDAHSFVDIIPADWVRSRKLPYSVLTVYRPYNSSFKRRDLLGASFASMQSEIRKKAVPFLKDCGLEEKDIVDINLARWGHPMIACRPGQMSSGLFEAAAKPFGGIFFAQQDSHGVPAIENAIGAGEDAAREAKRYLAG